MSEPIITREISSIPERNDDAHKGQVGRVMVIGGCDEDVLMVGATALTANAALRSGAGLIQVLVPEPLRASVAILTPCSTTRTLPTSVDKLMQAVDDFHADVVAVGPGLGSSIDAEVLKEFLTATSAITVVDADALNLLASLSSPPNLNPQRTVITPHPGEMRRLLSSVKSTPPEENTAQERRQAACDLVKNFNATVVLKGKGTIVTDGNRLYVNETGNAGMATGGTGDVLTGIIAALIGQGMEVLEASILGVYLHGLAGDFASQEMGRCSMTALDLIEYLPEAFSEHEIIKME